jgi:hypothetical protein
MTLPQSIVQLFQPWNDFYSHSKGAETVVQTLHIGGVLLAGGLAISADRATLRTVRGVVADRSQQLRELAAVHRWVITGLVIVVISGLAMFTSDIETFFGSWLFWTKMGLIGLLLINGLTMTRAEASLGRDSSGASPAWQSLRRSAVVSLFLWFVITALGVAIVNLS